MNSISITALPALDQPLDGGTFAGVFTKKDGTHCAVVKLPGQATSVTWQQAMDWAKAQGGELPTRPVAALLFANIQDRPQSGWHWTSEEFKDDDEEDASCAWSCVFGSGHQLLNRKSFQGSAVAVRLIPLTA